MPAGQTITRSGSRVAATALFVLVGYAPPADAKPKAVGLPDADVRGARRAEAVLADPAGALHPPRGADAPGKLPLLLRKARCESTLNPYARNASGATGLLQFMPGTWRTTPYGGRSILSAKWNALAGAWMHRPEVGRGGEWVCR